MRTLKRMLSPEHEPGKEGWEAGLNIRNALAEELDEVSGVILDAYSQYSALMPDKVWQAYKKNLMDVRSRFDVSEIIVAVENNHILGTVTFYPDGSASKEEGWPSGYSSIRLLAVHPDTRGRGFGRILTEECVRRSRELGVRCVGLHTTEFMSVAAAMYERMGFKRSPEFDFTPAPGLQVTAYLLDL